MKNRSRSAVVLAVAAATAIGGTALWQVNASESIPIDEVLHIHGISVDPMDPARLYLATHHGVYRTAPDGTAEPVSENQNDYMGFTPHPSDQGVFYASGHPAGGGNLGFIASEDGGRNWSGLGA